VQFVLHEFIEFIKDHPNFEGRGSQERTAQAESEEEEVPETVQVRPYASVPRPTRLLEVVCFLRKPFNFII